MIARSYHASSLPLPDTADGSPPEWVELIPAGRFFGRDGRGPFELDPAAVAAAFVRAAVDLPIDYEHQTLDASAKAGPVPAAGWIKAIELRDGALWGRVEWTPHAAELVRNKSYRYISPVFRHDKSGRIVALEGAGLTHYPNLHLQPVANSKGDDNMDLTPLAEALGIDPSADIETIAAHAKQLREAATRDPDPAQWVPMSQHRAVAEELARLQAQVAKEKAEALVSAAMSAGKLAPALKDWALSYASKDPEGFASWADKAPVILSPESERVAHASTPADQLTEEDRIACALLGMSEADFAAHKRNLIKE